nr:PREDICTED: uncharacterized protein LOC106706512 [Latimeria chalumnae]|eukprot:XP_014353075.1 PREDICTED: uncharacterized protein LOC106706512 [Latimeria chalumnae]
MLVLQALGKSFKVEKFVVHEVRNIRGDLEIKGFAYVDSVAFIELKEVLRSLYSLVNQSVDLITLTVNGVRAELNVMKMDFTIDVKYDARLVNHSSEYNHHFSKLITNVVESMLRRKYSQFLQFVIRHFLRGSVVCRGDLVFQNPALASRDVLDFFLEGIEPDGFLPGTLLEVDPYSVRVEDSKLEYLPVQEHFPGFVIAIIILGTFAIVLLPISVYLCLRWGLCKSSKRRDFAMEKYEMTQDAQQVQPSLGKYKMNSL